MADLGRHEQARAIVDALTDDELGALMTNLGGHDIETVLDALATAEADGDRPTCFIAYTIKGMGLPFAGHKDNHSGLMTREQMEIFRESMRVRPGHEWDRFEGLQVPPETLQAFIGACGFASPLTAGGTRAASARDRRACCGADAQAGGDVGYRRRPGSARFWARSDERRARGGRWRRGLSPPVRM